MPVLQRPTETVTHHENFRRYARNTGWPAWCWLLLSVSEFTGRAFADSLPTFSDPVVNTFVKTYSQFVDSYVDAARTGDTARLGWHPSKRVGTPAATSLSSLSQMEK